MSTRAAQYATDPTRVSQRELIDLAAEAHGLSLDHLRVRAARGGARLSPLLGRGMEFDEARPYQPGDEPRNIDWRITARTGKPYTKMFREERERPVIVFVDLRSSMHFATTGVYKAVQAARLAASVSWIARNHGDRVGGFLFAEGFHRELKPRLGQRGALRLIHELAEAPVWQPSESLSETPEAAMNRALTGLRQVAKSGSLVVVITDGRHLDDAAIRQLKGLARNNDILVFHIYDPLEAELPPPGQYNVLHDQAIRTLRADDKQQRIQHRKSFEALSDRLKTVTVAQRLRYFKVSTADATDDIMRDLFLAKRAAR